MKLTAEEKIGMVVTEDTNRINQRFIAEAIRAWDYTPGCVGLFAEYVKSFIKRSWLDMVLRN